MPSWPTIDRASLPSASTDGDGVRRLWEAVLKTAITDLTALLSGNPMLTVGMKLDRAAKAELLTSTLAWFKSNDDEPCSLIFVCDALGLDVDQVRTRVRKILDGTVTVKTHRKRLPAAARLDILRCLEDRSATTRELGLRYHVDSSTCRKVRLQWLAELGLTKEDQKWRKTTTRRRTQSVQGAASTRRRITRNADAAAHAP